MPLEVQVRLVAEGLTPDEVSETLDYWDDGALHAALVRQSRRLRRFLGPDLYEALVVLCASDLWPDPDA